MVKQKVTAQNLLNKIHVWCETSHPPISSPVGVEMLCEGGLKGRAKWAVGFLMRVRGTRTPECSALHWVLCCADYGCGPE